MESSEKTAFALFSRILIVDAVHSFSVVLSSSIILIGIKISERPARGLPYRLQKDQKTGSPGLITDARHIWTCMLFSVVILMALYRCTIGFTVDKYAAAMVVLIIAQSSIRNFLDSIRFFLDASLRFNNLTRIREIVLSDFRVVTINTLSTSNTGAEKALTAILNIQGSASGAAYLEAFLISARKVVSLDLSFKLIL